MEYYTSLTDAWLDCLNFVLKGGRFLSSRAGGCREVIGHSFTLEQPARNVVISKARSFSMPYACAETLWYLSGDNSIKMIEAYAPSYKTFAEDDGAAHGAYGHRWFNNRDLPSDEDQLSLIIEILREKPESRQAIIQHWMPADLIHAKNGDRRDLPCTLSLQFLLRDEQLHLIANMRSNDIWLGLPYDVFAFTTIQAIVAGALGVPRGKYVHNVGSLHLYDRNALKAEQSLKSGDDWSYKATSYPTMPIRRFAFNSFSIAEALTAEKQVRRGRAPLSCENPILNDLVTGCSTKWIDLKPAYYEPYYQYFFDRGQL